MKQHTQTFTRSLKTRASRNFLKTLQSARSALKRPTNAYSRRSSMLTLANAQCLLLLHSTALGARLARNFHDEPVQRAASSTTRGPKNEKIRRRNEDDSLGTWQVSRRIAQSQDVTSGQRCRSPEIHRGRRLEFRVILRLGTGMMSESDGAGTLGAT